VSLCGKPFKLLVLMSYFTVKRHFMLWRSGEYC